MGNARDVSYNVDEKFDSVRDEMNELKDYVMESIEELAESIDVYENLFDDTDDAETAHDMKQTAGNYDIYDQYDLDEALTHLQQWQELGDVDEVTALVEKADADDVESLRNEIVVLKDQLEQAKEQRLIALNVLDGLPLDRHNEVIAKIQEDLKEQQREAEEKAYIAGQLSEIEVPSSEIVTVVLTDVTEEDKS